MATLFLDTSILLSEGKEVFGQEGVDTFVVSTKSLESIGRRVSDPNLGYNARNIIKYVDTKMSYGLPDDGIVLEITPQDILEECVNDSTEVGDSFFLSSDPVQRVLAISLGVTLADYSYSEIADYRKRVPEVYVSQEDLDSLKNSGEITLSEDIAINQGVILKSSESSSSLLAVAERNFKFKLLPDVTLNSLKKSVSGKNAEQRFALNSLMNDDITYSFLDGVPGGGKTFLAIASALEKLYDKKSSIKNIIVFRTLSDVGGESLGYLPGTVEEKMEERAEPIRNILYELLDKSEADRLLLNGTIKVMPISFLRGATLSSTFVILDEAQNLSKDAIKTVLTRAGKSSKYAISMDTNQIDRKELIGNPEILSVIDSLWESKYFSHTYFNKSERSKAAEEIANLLS